MISRECKRLVEVDFPIAVVSKHVAREKSIRHGHPSTLHLWWARRPLASSCAVLLAPLLPDTATPPPVTLTAPPQSGQVTGTGAAKVSSTRAGHGRHPLDNANLDAFAERVAHMTSINAAR